MTMQSLHQMSCEEAALAVWGYLDGEIDAERAARIRAHLDECDHCRDLYTFEGRFLNAVARLLDESNELPALRSRILDALRRQGFDERR